MPEPKPTSWKTRLANIGTVFFGMIMAITPLTLWVAPTKPWFYFVLESFAISSVMVWLLIKYETTATDHQQQQTDGKGKTCLPDEFIEQVQNLRMLGRSKSTHTSVKDFVDKHKG